MAYDLQPHLLPTNYYLLKFMWLFLDPRDEKMIIKIGIMEHGQEPWFFEYDRNKEISLLGAVYERLQSTDYSLQNLRGMIVVPGSGGFSVVRSAAVLANSIAFATKTPILEIIPKNNETAEEIFKRGVKMIESGKRSGEIKPLYGKEPNITIKKD